MALGDYMTCTQCDQKAFYDADVNYPDGVKVAALCRECSLDFDLAVVAIRKAEAEPALKVGDFEP